MRLDQAALGMGDRLANVAAYLACGLAITGTVLKARLDRHRRKDPAMRFASAFGLSIGTAMAVTAPATATAVRHLGPLPDLLTLIGDQLKLVAAGSLAMMAHSLNAPGRARTGLRRQSVLLGVTVVLEIVAYLSAGATRVGDEVTVRGTGRLILVGYIVLFTAYGIWCLGVFSLLIGRRAWDVPPGLLRLGSLLMSVASAVGLAWLADNGRDMAHVLTTGGEDAAESPFSALAALVCVTVGFTGAMVSSWVGARPGAAPSPPATQNDHGPSDHRPSDRTGR
ncbi:hypothetical protein [Kitasatospora sp. NPDC001175]|uniref:hypothetical protein n=1 Tax=Kitasatospora sp. NPDC001175 TaxID=3157103 RepID=UPI003D0154ED